MLHKNDFAPDLVRSVLDILPLEINLPTVNGLKYHTIDAFFQELRKAMKSIDASVDESTLHLLLEPFVALLRDCSGTTLPKMEEFWATMVDEALENAQREKRTAFDAAQGDTEEVAADDDKQVHLPITIAYITSSLRPIYDSTTATDTTAIVKRKNRDACKKLLEKCGVVFPKPVKVLVLEDPSIKKEQKIVEKMAVKAEKKRKRVEEAELLESQTVFDLNEEAMRAFGFNVGTLGL